MDKNLQFRQNLAAHAIEVILVRARSNRIGDLSRVPGPGSPPARRPSPDARRR